MAAARNGGGEGVRRMPLNAAGDARPMRTVHAPRSAIRRPLADAPFVAACLLAAGCTTTPSTSTPPPDEPEAIVSRERFVPVIRYGRYTLVELTPTAAQQDLLLQVVQIAIPDAMQASVGDAVRHVLLRSGYRLCDGRAADALNGLPLPMAHYRLGPLTLRDALLTLLGPGWALEFDDVTRQACVAAASPSPIALTPPPSVHANETRDTETILHDEEPQP